MIVMEPSSKILAVLSVIKQEVEVVYVEEPSHETCQRSGALAAWNLMCSEKPLFTNES